ncbi:MAG: hypothetical protein JW712_00910 [Dehalococcoidales bacterium]|nr:hypothetical protein [Dehalococcoidales bacterium]
MDFREALVTAKKTLAVDMACSTEDFDREGIHIYEAKELEGRRKFPFRNPSLVMAAFGKGVVISCNSERVQWARETFGTYSPDYIFSIPALALMEQRVSGDNQAMAGPDLKYVCGDNTFRTVSPPEAVELFLVGEEEVADLYGDSRFLNALGRKYNPDRPRIVSVMAKNGDAIIGIAAASADSDEMYQVGVDTVPGWQGKGVAASMVSLVTQAILDMNKVPYYSTSPNNLASQKTALSAGYKPAWTEVYALEKFR